MYKSTMDFKIIFAVFFLVYAPASHALKFHSYTNEKGETVFSNVPKKCIQNSSLACMGRHPVLSQGVSKSSSSENQKKKLNQAKKQAERSRQTSKNTNPYRKPVSQQFEVLQRVVEMNKLMNEYYPGKPDPVEAKKARQQQEDILDVLQIIKNAAGSEEKSSIDKAIDVLRSNLIE